MTTLISWITYDQNKQASIYVASDSRLSWTKHETWDSGRKVYCSDKYPDILGYCGDVLFCSQVISQVMTYIDSCEVFEDLNCPHKRFQLICNLIERSFGEYPAKYAFDSFKIIYVTRIEKYCFAAFLITWNKRNGWNFEELAIPDSTETVLVAGSGAQEYNDRYSQEYSSSDIGGYSRSFYSCLYRHVTSGNDPLTGGAIQLAGVFNAKPAKHHGVVMKEKRYVYGMEVDDTEKINSVRWVNENFENCDGNDLKRFETAQRQPLPRNISKSLGNASHRKPLPR